MSEIIDPNVDFNAAMRAARDKSREANVQPEPGERGGPAGPPPDPTTLTHVSQQIERAAEPQPRETDTGQYMSPDDPLARFHRLSAPEQPAPTPPAPEPPAPDPGVPEPPVETPAQRADRLLGDLDDETRSALTERFAPAAPAAPDPEVAALRAELASVQARMNAQPVAPSYPPLAEEQLEVGLGIDVEQGTVDNSRARQFIAELYGVDHPSYDQALELWADQSPGPAMRWAAEVARNEALTMARQEFAPVAERAMVSDHQQTWNDQWRAFATDHPEVMELTDRMLTDMEQNPWLGAPIQAGVPDAEAKVIENLYHRALAQTRPQVAAAAEEVRQEVRDMKVASTVADPAASARQVGDQLTPQEADERALKESILGHDGGMSVHAAIASSRGAQ